MDLLSSHIANVDNPHQVKKADIGLANVLNVAQRAASDLTGIVPVGCVVAFVGSSGGSGAYTLPATGVVDANGWMRSDGAAIPAGNTLTGTTYNLSDSRFLMGSTTSGTATNTSSITIGSANLPTHTHDIAHTHAASSVTGTTNIAHTHGSSAVSGTVSVAADAAGSGSITSGSTSAASQNFPSFFSGSLSAAGQTLGTTNVSLDSGSAAGQTLSTTASGNGGFANTSITVPPPINITVVYLVRVK